MQNKIYLSFITLLLLISFGSVNAVLFTPALPEITRFFHISSSMAQQTITWFLIGYALGQLVYGPIANRFGRKPALYTGVLLQIFSSMMCLFAAYILSFHLLIFSRFFLALGSGVGLKMTFTLLSECYQDPKIISEKTSYLMLAFAITPGISVALGGFLTEHYGWMSCFYAEIFYGIIMLLRVMQLPETLITPNYNALKLNHLMHGYISQFKNIKLVAGSILMGSRTAFVYVFAAVAPFVAMNLFGMNSAEYGFANLLPPLGLILGSFCSAQLVKRYSLQSIIKYGIYVACLGALIMIMNIILNLSALLSLFLPMFTIYFAVSLTASITTITMKQTQDKAHGSAVMNFINMTMATAMVLVVGTFDIDMFLLPSIFILLCCVMIATYQWVFHFLPGKIVTNH